MKQMQIVRIEKFEIIPGERQTVHDIKSIINKTQDLTVLYWEPVPLDGERETQEQLSLADQVDEPFDVTEILRFPELYETVLPDRTETVQGAASCVSVYEAEELPHENVIVQDLELPDVFS